MDAATLEMVLTAFEETREESLAQGKSGDDATKEALVAAAMCLSAMTGVEDAEARAQIEALNPLKRLAA